MNRAERRRAQRSGWTQAKRDAFDLFQAEAALSFGLTQAEIEKTVEVIGQVNQRYIEQILAIAAHTLGNREAATIGAQLVWYSAMIGGSAPLKRIPVLKRETVELMLPRLASDPGMCILFWADMAARAVTKVVNSNMSK